MAPSAHSLGTCKLLVHGQRVRATLARELPRRWPRVAGRLRTSVSVHGFLVRPINYRLYHLGSGFSDDMEALLTKRLNFKSECELRLLKFDESHYRALVRKDPSVSELPGHIYVDWVLSDVIEKILVSPYADENCEQLVRLAVSAADPTVVVELSELHKRGFREGTLGPLIGRWCLRSLVRCHTQGSGREQFGSQAGNFSGEPVSP
jgi:hypothetical protein